MMVHIYTRAFDVSNILGVVKVSEIALWGACPRAVHQLTGKPSLAYHSGKRLLASGE
jgi:hypothetical protein